LDIPCSPAKAGVHLRSARHETGRRWAPAFAGAHSYYSPRSWILLVPPRRRGSISGRRDMEPAGDGSPPSRRHGISFLCVLCVLCANPLPSSAPPRLRVNFFRRRRTFRLFREGRDPAGFPLSGMTK
jgi:hypothetical protein